MSKGKIERPDLKQVKKRAENGWGASPNHVLWMINMLEDSRVCLSRVNTKRAWEWHEEYDEANGT